jgi:diadenosine tetraphosphate (Ap4A) HIT family hydrolase
MGKMANETMQRFGYPGSLVRDFEHWVVLLRPGQVTLGSLVLAAKSDARAFGALPAGAHAELARIPTYIFTSFRGTTGHGRCTKSRLQIAAGLVRRISRRQLNCLKPHSACFLTGSCKIGY